MILFTVEDSGIGINPEKADKLFQKFYQIDTDPLVSAIRQQE